MQKRCLGGMCVFIGYTADLKLPSFYVYLLNNLYTLNAYIHSRGLISVVQRNTKTISFTCCVCRCPGIHSGSLTLLVQFKCSTTHFKDLTLEMLQCRLSNGDNMTWSSDKTNQWVRCFTQENGWVKSTPI